MWVEVVVVVGAGQRGKTRPSCAIVPPTLSWAAAVVRSMDCNSPGNCPAVSIVSVTRQTSLDSGTSRAPCLAVVMQKSAGGCAKPQSLSFCRAVSHIASADCGVFSKVCKMAILRISGPKIRRKSAIKQQWGPLTPRASLGDTMQCRSTSLTIGWRQRKCVRQPLMPVRSAIRRAACAASSSGVRSLETVTIHGWCPAEWKATVISPACSSGSLLTHSKAQSFASVSLEVSECQHVVERVDCSEGSLKGARVQRIAGSSVRTPGRKGSVTSTPGGAKFHLRRATSCDRACGVLQNCTVRRAASNAEASSWMPSVHTSKPAGRKSTGTVRQPGGKFAPCKTSCTTGKLGSGLCRTQTSTIGCTRV